ncbi:hypothetical protein LIER_00077 [Lithospermum erythrorhizon]|uniref:HAT C-terminal dimerisation domain-containing protein n=1 Tax=Lithospermum erythrorhizon TaxID=34254 RepID=A0AAV3NG49_LITER
MTGVKFDVLIWWMGNEEKYHVLSKMAKDIITILVTTVASESTFSVGKRVIDPKRASMKTDTVDMLLCGGNWVKEMHGLKRGSVQSILEKPQDKPLEYHFGQESEIASTT